MAATVKDSLFLSRQAGSVHRMDSTAPLTSTMLVSEEEERQIMYSAASMLVRFAVTVLTVQPDERAGSLFATPAVAQESALVGSMKAATAAVEAAAVSELFARPASLLMDGDSDAQWSTSDTGRRTNRRRPASALEELMTEVRELRALPRSHAAAPTDEEAVRTLFPTEAKPCAHSTACPLSASSRGILITSALWLSVKFWTRTKVSLSLNRILFDCLDRNNAEARTSPAPVSCRDTGALGTGGVCGGGAPGASTPREPSDDGVGDNDIGTLHDDILMLQPSQWSAPRGAVGAGLLGGGFDAIGYVLQGIEEFEMILLRCCGYTVPLPFQ